MDYKILEDYQIKRSKKKKKRRKFEELNDSFASDGNLSSKEIDSKL